MVEARIRVEPGCGREARIGLWLRLGLELNQDIDMKLGLVLHFHTFK